MFDALTIMDGTITATCEGSHAYGAGIGTGRTYAPERPAHSGFGTVTIVNGTINATCTAVTSAYGAGIGTGQAFGYYEGDVSSTFRNVVIMNGTITTTCTGPTALGAGIGTGQTVSGDPGGASSTFEKVVIMNGTITTTCTGSSALGAGIGTGQVQKDRGSCTSTFTNLTITGGVVSARSGGSASSGYAIGPRTGGTFDVLQLSGTTTVKGARLRASSILLSDGSLLFVTDQSTLFLVTPSVSGTVDIAVLFSIKTAENAPTFSWLNRPVLRIGELKDVAGSGRNLCLLSSGTGRCFSDPLILLQSLAVSVPGPGNYSISVQGGGPAGYLAEPDGPPEFVVESTGLFVPVAQLYLIPPHCPLGARTL
jgi:hypothetical protein